MYTQIGWVGMIVFLAAYALVANKKVPPTSIVYNAMNGLGALAIAYSLLPVKAWPTIALEGCFVLIAVRAIWKNLRT